MTKEALKLALEALGLAKHSHGVLLLSDPPQEAWKTYQVDAALSKAITAIKEALANEALEKMAENARELGLDYEPEQESVTWRNAAIRVGEDLCSVGPFRYYDMTAEQWLDWALSVVTVHAPPPQRTWIGLTDGEVDKMILLMGFPPDWITENAIVKNIVRNLEAKLKEKNNE